MKFNIENYANNDVVMHCETEEQANIFCRYLHNTGRSWHGGRSYIDITHFSHELENTCYNFNHGTYCSKDYYIDEEYTILEFSDFEWDGYNDNIEVCDEDKEALDEFLFAYR